ncbi:MAG: zinc ribbon domain-containing protein [Planctomycetota bacterium]
MAMVKCKECGRKVSTKAKACPQCGAPPKAQGSGCSGVVAALALVGGLIWLVQSGTDVDQVGARRSTPQGESSSEVAPDERWRERSDTVSAYIMTERFVRERLKAPRTAKFPGIFDGQQDHVSYLGDQQYAIVSYVDSENGFGAMLRMRFAAKVEQVEEDKWRLLSLDMFE